MISDYATIPSKCATCDRCRRYIEGPKRGRCLYNGPFVGYQRYLGNNTYGPVEGKNK